MFKYRILNNDYYSFSWTNILVVVVTLGNIIWILRLWFCSPLLFTLINQYTWFLSKCLSICLSSVICYNFTNLLHGWELSKVIQITLGFFLVKKNLCNECRISGIDWMEIEDWSLIWFNFSQSFTFKFSGGGMKSPWWLRVEELWAQCGEDSITVL